MNEVKSVPHIFEPIAEGLVTRRQPGTNSTVASGPRSAVTRDGDLVCSFMVQTALGSNDFTPMLSRSTDGGLTWHDEHPIWPALQGKFSIFGSVSGSPQGELFFFGSRTPIDTPGETFWSDATQGLKQNELVWSRSPDAGRTWQQPQVIPMPFPGSAEAPGAMCIARDGAWHACYSPYNTFDPQLAVPRNQVAVVSSRDEGRTWHGGSMLRFDDELSTGAEAWVIELADGRLLGACWNMNQRDGSDFPNAYALSRDGGRSWGPTRSTGIRGQSVALTPLADGSALFLYNQRKHGEVGVWIARVRPGDDDFGIESNTIAWKAPSPRGVAATSQKDDSSQSATEAPATDHAQWTSFSFGEPSATVLPDGSIFVALWYSDNDVGSIRYVKLRLIDK